MDLKTKQDNAIKYLTDAMETLETRAKEAIKLLKVTEWPSINHKGVLKNGDWIGDYAVFYYGKNSPNLSGTPTNVQVLSDATTGQILLFASANDAQTYVDSHNLFYLMNWGDWNIGRCNTSCCK